MSETIRFIVLVKAAPVLTRALDETMCVAGARLDTAAPEWVRLHPVPFRDLADENRFAKYQGVSVDVRRPRSDRRPESWSPLYGTIAPGKFLGTENGWAQRRRIIDRLHEANMCHLEEANRGGSGPDTQSLAVVRPVSPPKLRITERDDDQLKKWRLRAAGAAARQSLFDDPDDRKPDFEVVPWRFQYEYQCRAPGCRTHTQTIVDWEALTLWRHVRRYRDWRERMRSKFEDEMWERRDSVLFVGNQEEYPTSFLVLGVFWPPVGGAQGVFDL